MDLEMDILSCSWNGKKDELAAKATAANIRSQLTQLGFDPQVYLTIQLQKLKHC